MRRPLTTRTIASLKPGQWARDVRPRGTGQLEARRLAAGVAWYYRYTAADGRQVRLPLGISISLAEARERADALARRYQAGERELSGPAPAARPASLGDLLTAYADSLAGRPSERAVRLAILRHVRDALPSLWAAPAAALALDDLLPAVGRLVRAGKLREAAKMRSYLRAAYAAAIRARQDPAAPDSLRALGISANPARDIATVAGASRPRGRAMSLSELRAYWHSIASVGDATGAALRFHLLTGGQRIAQLARATVADLDLDAAMLRLMDGKGRRRLPRVHWVPLIPAAVADLRAMCGGTLGPHLLTLNEGVTPASYDTLRGAMDKAARQAQIPPVTPGLLRATVETVLAGAGVSDETRAHLQSHGLGGIQTRHYNMHAYEAEKRQALELLHRLLHGHR